MAPAGFETRPTGDRMKEDLFNILGSCVRGAVFLDLFCGSGAIGIEALSRGADLAVFVDDSREAVRAVETNLKKTGLWAGAELLCLSALRAIENELSGRVYDLIFLDPPYESGELLSALYNIDRAGLLANNGLLVAECPAGIELPDFSGLRFFRRKNYAQMQFAFYEKKGRGSE